MAETSTAYIGLGSNLGDRLGYMEKALSLLAETDGVKVIQSSSTIESAALGRKEQPDYLNAVAEIKTQLNADELFGRLTDIEKSLGRSRAEKWASRTMDLDMLLFGEKVINELKLTVPHRQMHLRSFVLAGLCELNESLVHPVLKQPVAELAARLNGVDFVLNPALPQLVCIAGIIGVGKTTLARGLSNAMECDLILEAYDTNPFLSEVYAGKKELALNSQLYFLASRVEQLSNNALSPDRLAVADYVFDKELIYADTLLDSRQQPLYRRINRYLAEKIAKPTLVIYLQDSPQNCLRRIQKRNRPYELQIELKFLQNLCDDYENLFSNWTTCPLIKMSMSKFDCTSEKDVIQLADEIKSYVAPVE